jgi:hypothetical protein
MARRDTYSYLPSANSPTTPRLPCLDMTEHTLNSCTKIGNRNWNRNRNQNAGRTELTGGRRIIRKGSGRLRGTGIGELFFSVFGLVLVVLSGMILSNILIWRSSFISSPRILSGLFYSAIPNSPVCYLVKPPPDHVTTHNNRLSTLLSTACNNHDTNTNVVGSSRRILKTSNV